jgi:adenylate cyclase
VSVRDILRWIRNEVRQVLRVVRPKPVSRSTRRVAKALLLGIAVSLAVTGASQVGALAGWETRAVDMFLFFRDRVPAPEIVLVTIDDESFEALGARQPLPRDYLADIADFLLKSGARVVAFDVLLKSASVPAEDARLIATARQWHERAKGRIVFAAVAVPESPGKAPVYSLSPPFTQELPVTFAYANAPVGADGIIRRAVPVLPAANGGFLPSLALAALAGYAGHSTEDMARALHAKGHEGITLPVRTAGGGIMRNEAVTTRALAKAPWRIAYVGQAGAIQSFPSSAIRAAAQSGMKPEADNPFNGKIVFVGATFADSRDFFPTPVGLMPGVEIHANIANTLLDRRALLPPSWILNLSVLVSACVIVSLLSLWFRPIWVSVISFALVAVFAVVSYEAYTKGGYWLDFVGPLLGMKIYIYGSRIIARRRLASAFGEYVSPEVMDRVLLDGARLGGEVRTVSVLMSDLRGFTTMSEKLQPAQITEIMNEYMTAMVDVIMNHRGMVSDFIGDGILAFFGAPSDDPDHAWHATQTALGMQAALDRLNAQWAKAGRPSLAMGIAVNTGSVFAGNVGSPKKKKYAVMGDPVNTVSRMEGQNRELGTSILISEATLAVVNGRVAVRDRGAVKVKGKAEPVVLFELVGLADARQVKEVRA